ncbi:hypothetical protein [Pseudogemmobacter humi]|uniref:Uncharacterized protein n=1 Tax=Pseudogemmobacter humi TaxID=2483812 RepID=A0A3P5XIM8_9RHOB|nr:hypothetical protein [Pseudogemmobacter humi]VDC28581.1 hypothetical protein XINFAN_02159 [Pseudogemmobacter humi]
MMRPALTALLAGALFALPAMAEAPLGCFARDYSADHLRKNPNQHVAALRLNFHNAPGSPGPVVDVIGRFADQGRARRDGLANEYFTQSAFCMDEGRRTSCYVECDGGGFAIRALKGDVLEIETDYFRVEGGGGCEGMSDLAEPGGGKTIYRLTRAPAATCRGVE